MALSRWALDSCLCVQTLLDHWGGKRVFCVAALPEGRVIVGTDDGLEIWDVSDDAFEPDSSDDESVDGRRTVRPFDPRLLYTLPDPRPPYPGGDQVNCVAVLPRGRVAAGGDENLLVWDLAERRVLHTLMENVFVNCVAVLPNGCFVSGAGIQPNENWDEDEENHYATHLKVWHPDDGRRLQSLDGHLGGVQSVAPLPDGRLVSAASFPDNHLRVWDLADGRCLQILRGHANCVSCATALPNGRIVSADQYATSTLKVWAERDREIETQVAREVARQRAVDDVVPEIAKFI